jgi:hypothetical protein
VYSWSSPLLKDPDPLAAEPLFWWRWRLSDERGFPPWLFPAPSLRLLARPPELRPPRVRYAPAVAGLLSGTPARHLRNADGD